MRMSTDEVARKIGVVEQTVRKWEAGEKNPNYRQLERLAKLYQRPIAALFLPAPPPEPPAPTDFRTFHSGKLVPISQKTLLAIRKARRLQSLSTELPEESGGASKSELPAVKPSSDPETVARLVRGELGIDLETQMRKWKDAREAFQEWKKAIQSRGILVSELSIPTKEACAFSLGGETSVIAVSRRDSITGRTFSLFHEYGHLSLGESGICNLQEIDDPDRRQQLAIEKFCNHFAGAILVPSDALRTHPLVADVESATEWSDLQAPLDPA